MHIAALICQPASNFPTKLLLILYKRLSTFRMVGGKPSGADLRFETGLNLDHPGCPAWLVAGSSRLVGGKKVTGADMSVSPVCADDDQVWTVVIRN